MITPRKALYELPASFYLGVGGPIAYSRHLGCDSILFSRRLLSPEKVAAAQAAGLHAWVYASPPSWGAATWRTTVMAMREAKRTYPSLLGYIADPEGPDTDPDASWAGDTAAEAEALADALEVDARAGGSIGFTSFPYWKHRAVIARRAPSVWGSPQLYGIRETPRPSIATILGWAAPWKTLFPGPRYVPSLAAWGRTGENFRAYLDAMRVQPAGLFWQNGSPPAGADDAALAAWQPGARPGSGGGILGVLAALGLGYAAWKVLR